MTASPPNASLFESPIAARVKNLLIVLVAIVLSVAVFFGLQTETKTATLASLAQSAVPIEVAMTNGKPTLVEFYANWCTVCQAMAEDVGTLKSQYEGEVNFVMLNVDNTKWLPEMLHYHVDGIPHFVFLDSQAEAIASTIGEQPRAVMADNLEALVAGLPLPHAQSIGQASIVETPSVSTGTGDPRRHGSQVVTQQAF